MKWRNKGFGDEASLLSLKALLSSLLAILSSGDASAPKRSKEILRIRSSIFVRHLEIDADSFGIDSSATFAAVRTSRQSGSLPKKISTSSMTKRRVVFTSMKMAQTKAGDGGIIAILKGAPDLTASNLEFI